MTAYLGLDLSLTATGIVLLGTDGQLLQHRTVRTEPGQPAGRRLALIVDEVVDSWRRWQPALVAAEQQAMHAKFAASAIGEVHGAVKYGLAKAGLPVPLYVAATTLKKYATGRGNGEKSDVKMAILEKWKERMTQNDQADAYVLARIAGGVHGGLPAQLSYERECVVSVRSSPWNVEALAALGRTA